MYVVDCVLSILLCCGCWPSIWWTAFFVFFLSGPLWHSSADHLIIYGWWPQVTLFFFFYTAVVLAFFVVVTLSVIFLGVLLFVRYICRPCCCTAVVLSLWLFYHYRSHIVGSWGVGACFFSAVCCAVLLLYQILRTAVVGTTYCCTTGWLGGSVRGCVHAFLFFSFLLSRYTGPALA